MTALLADHAWKSKYHSDAGSLVKQFYEPALECALALQPARQAARTALAALQPPSSTARAAGCGAHTS